MNRQETIKKLDVVVTAFEKVLRENADVRDAWDALRKDHPEQLPELLVTALAYARARRM